MNVIISIGRNIGNEPMDDSRWASFCLKTHEIAQRHCTHIYFSGQGAGVFEGVVEESFTVIGEFVSNTDIVPGLTNSTDIVDELGRLAKAYGQEAIAVTFGTPIFAGAK